MSAAASCRAFQSQTSADRGHAVVHFASDNFFALSYLVVNAGSFANGFGRFADGFAGIDRPPFGGAGAERSYVRTDGAALSAAHLRSKADGFAAELKAENAAQNQEQQPHQTDAHNVDQRLYFVCIDQLHNFIITAFASGNGLQSELNVDADDQSQENEREKRIHKHFPAGACVLGSQLERPCRNQERHQSADHAESDHGVDQIEAESQADQPAEAPDNQAAEQHCQIRETEPVAGFVLGNTHQRTADGSGDRQFLLYRTDETVNLGKQSGRIVSLGNRYAVAQLSGRGTGHKGGGRIAVCAAEQETAAEFHRRVQQRLKNQPVQFLHMGQNQIGQKDFKAHGQQVGNIFRPVLLGKGTDLLERDKRNIKGKADQKQILKSCRQCVVRSNAHCLCGVEQNDKQRTQNAFPALFKLERQRNASVHQPADGLHVFVHVNLLAFRGFVNGNGISCLIKLIKFVGNGFQIAGQDIGTVALNVFGGSYRRIYIGCRFGISVLLEVGRDFIRGSEYILSSTADNIPYAGKEAVRSFVPCSCRISRTGYVVQTGSFCRQIFGILERNSFNVF